MAVPREKFAWLAGPRTPTTLFLRGVPAGTPQHKQPLPLGLVWSVGSVLWRGPVLWVWGVALGEAEN